MSKLRKLTGRRTSADDGLKKSAGSSADTQSIRGPVRFARQAAELTSLRAGDIALVSLPDLEVRQAQELIAVEVAAVLNSAASSTGRVRNQGPQLLSDAGITLVDVSSESIWSRLSNGDVIELVDGRVLLDGVLVTAGQVQGSRQSAATSKSATEGRGTRLDAIATNATDHIAREKDMLLDGARVPHIRSRIAGRPAVVVSAGYDAVADLRKLKRYIAQKDPVLIAAGAGASVLLDAGYKPHVLVGDIDNFTDEAIRQAGEVVVTTATGKVSRPERLERHGREVSTFTSTGSDDDLAIVLADTNKAAVVVHVGAPRNLNDFLERAPSEAARMFVARLRAGPKLVDAKAVTYLSGRPMAIWPILLLLIAGLLALAVAISVTPVGQNWFDQLKDTLVSDVRPIGGLTP